MQIQNPALGGTLGFDTAQPISPLIPDSPFPDTTEIELLHQRFVQLPTYYTAPTLGGTTLFGGVTFYLTDDDQFQDYHGWGISWTREWARIPSQRVIWEGLDYAMPAVASTITFGTLYTVSAVVNNTGNNTLNMVTASGSWFVGQQVGLQWVVSATIGSTYYSNTFQQWYYTVQSAVPSGGNTILSLYPGNASFVFGAQNLASNQMIATLLTSSARLQPTNLGTRAKITYDYFLPGVSPGVTTPSDISVYTRFKVVDYNGVETQYCGTNSIPTASQWYSWVTSPISNLQDAEDSLFQLWKGQIYERKRVQFVPL